MKTGFGWIQAKPACSMAPVAVTPDELGSSWRDVRVDLPLMVEWNGRKFGAASSYPMAWSLTELVAHAAATRDLVAGTIIGIGTVSCAIHPKDNHMPPKTPTDPAIALTIVGNTAAKLSA